MQKLLQLSEMFMKKILKKGTSKGPEPKRIANLQAAQRVCIAETQFERAVLGGAMINGTAEV